jgi:hypothetical protein
MPLGRILTGSKREPGHCAKVRPSTSRAQTVRPVPENSLATLEAMALLARQTRFTVHVVVPREAHVVEHAREVARRAGVGVSVDLMAFSVRVRFEAARLSS